MIFHSGNNQHGATLIVALVMLVMMTMLAVSAITLSTVNLRIVGNMQAQKSVDAAAQDAIEQIMSNSSNFGIGATATFVSTIMGDAAVSAPVCLSSKVATGYSAVVGLSPDDNTWEVVASITDNVTGATSVIHQGVEIRMLAGNCF